MESGGSMSSSSSTSGSFSATSGLDRIKLKTKRASTSPRSEDEDCVFYPVSSADIIKLNVGGVKYFTTKSTLLGPSTSSSHNFFTGMFSGKYPIVKDEEGYTFIDRNGRLFEPILEYLRTQRLHLFGFDKDQVQAEALYYGIKIEGLSTISDETLAKELALARNKVEDKTILSKDVVEPAKKILSKMMELAQQGKDPTSQYFLESRQGIDDKVKEFKKRFQIQTVPSWIKQVVNAKVGDCFELGNKYENFKEVALSIQRYLSKHHQVSVQIEEKQVHINRGMIGDGFYFYNFSEVCSPQTTFSFPLCLQFIWVDPNKPNKP